MKGLIGEIKEFLTDQNKRSQREVISISHDYDPDESQFNAIITYKCIVDCVCEDDED